MNGDKDRAISYLYKAVEEGFKDLDKVRESRPSRFYSKTSDSRS